jgi:hypothetical protein
MVQLKQAYVVRCAAILRHSNLAHMERLGEVEASETFDDASLTTDAGANLL